MLRSAPLLLPLLVLLAAGVLRDDPIRRAAASSESSSQSEEVPSFSSRSSLSSDWSHSSNSSDCVSQAQQWCEDTFGSGGNLTVGDGSSDGGFSCVCNNRTSVEVHVSSTGGETQCSAVGDGFVDVFGGTTCSWWTGLCPSACDDWSQLPCVHRTCAFNESSGFISLQCVTCEGRVLTVNGTSETCDMEYTAASTCDPAKTCNGHGCCVPPTAHSSSQCTCYSDSTNGYWTRSDCSECASGYDSAKECRARVSTPNFQIVLSSIATTWTMLSPNLAVPVLFVILGLARRLWDSDKSFALTQLRRAGLSPIQTARRGEQSLFHSKYIPNRPAKSRCFVNERAAAKRGPLPRGPPAY